MLKIAQKLVRDKIVAKIIEKGGEAKYRILDNEEYEKELFLKLSEEITEFEKDKNIEELGDIFGVFSAIVEHYGFTIEDVMKQSLEKEKQNGGFKEKIFLETWTPNKFLR